MNLKRQVYFLHAYFDSSIIKVLKVQVLNLWLVLAWFNAQLTVTQSISKPECMEFSWPHKGKRQTFSATVITCFCWLTVTAASPMETATDLYLYMVVPLQYWDCSTKLIRQEQLCESTWEFIYCMSILNSYCIERILPTISGVIFIDFIFMRKPWLWGITLWQKHNLHWWRCCRLSLIQKLK